MVPASSSRALSRILSKVIPIVAIYSFIWSSRLNLAALLFHPASYHMIMDPSTGAAAQTRCVHPIPPLAPVFIWPRERQRRTEMSVLNIHGRLLVSCARRPPAQMIRGSGFSFSRWETRQGSGRLRAPARQRWAAATSHRGLISQSLSTLKGV